MSQVRRRQFLITAGALLAAPFARAQTGGRRRSIAFVTSTSPLSEITGPEPVHPLRAFLHELRARGWTEGQNLILERRSAEGRFERAPDIFSEVAKGGAEIIVTVGPGFPRAAMKAAPTLPIVMIGRGPVEEGIVRSLARPGGNVTGVATDVGPEINAKQLELLKETLPKARRVAFLTTEVAGWGALSEEAIRSAARALGLELFEAEWGKNTLEAAFELIERKRPDALLVQGNAPHYARRAQIVNFARKARLPDFHAYREAVEIGALLSYGVDISDAFRKAAGYVDRILKGAKPGDLPMEQPTRFELGINTKTAKALGIMIPQSVLLRADRVIE